MIITHALTLDEQIAIEYSGTPNLFYLKAGNITLVLTQANIETLYSESFGAMLHADEKTGA
jgi:hypothetical protein